MTAYEVVVTGFFNVSALCGISCHISKVNVASVTHSGITTKDALFNFIVSSRVLQKFLLLTAPRAQEDDILH